MRTVNVVLILFFVFNCCAQLSTSKPIIKELNFLRTNNSINKCLIKYYVIENYCEKDLDSILYKYIADSNYVLFNHYNQVEMLFYKESERTNYNHLYNNRKDIDRYSQQNDLIFLFSWSKEMNKMYKYRYSNGEIVLPKSEILVEDIEIK
jgi:hypothetical protein